ncbi:bifunctional phosphoribosylaminoimidazolecarboxamide formyltransferase/IMP cyclohydrolase [Vagococcus fluvialis]|uniref:bifunctional phosphoribosylaminoimidazolecarboxamide formyltransferase/IMP cyclohydrolase n=1 Tax=Vagococcus fluvialis TaxID=2738 RepID=UPI001A90CB8B|nr:bifunctional phosphoribosylaminoimidazolecarboxamide formyltransferase/IMP cyclohydrolase [Vagococcus fluvialis]MBO0480040.1 bifunctional phosphoribosylaminoimidazolecarboxamide formyltransferase/IMP cyclohydrolase [Vagococcus fluvialis]MBO0483176.1 bifunctional phosphoribosylaminoimidazolecarboxamide formyltransferase/IMP cyclohydrolase [Vagococcus fluvialis]
MTTKRALISVSDKTGVVEFSKELRELGYEIISTGGTQKALEEAGITTLNIEDVTHFPEMLDGRVKTLHPMIHGGLLGKRSLPAHVETMKEHNIIPIDLVCVNLYPFKETLEKPGVSEDEIIENIDIGGPSMLRSASKNFESVTVVVEASDYETVLAEIKEFKETTLETRKKLAAKAFRHTASYDALIADYLTKSVEVAEPENLSLTFELQQSLRYGENSHQKASFYADKQRKPYAISSAKQLHGKELSFNNIKDADACLRIIREFERPAAVAVKHMNPCGIGIGETIFEAFNYAYESDPVSIFGGIIALNREVDLEIAEKLSHIFLEIIIAPSFSKEAFELLSQKKNIRLLTLDMTVTDSTDGKEYTSVLGGILVQEYDELKESRENFEVVTKREPTKEEWEALIFAYKSVKHVKSNAIVVANNHQTLGVGAGQMNRVGSVQIAIEQAKERLDGAVLSSDAFFPMSDSVETIGEAGIKAIIQPGGSIKDQESIDMADKYDIAMVFTKVRHFKH